MSEVPLQKRPLNVRIREGAPRIRGTGANPPSALPEGGHPRFSLLLDHSRASSCVIQESVRLKYAPSPEPIHISAQSCNQTHRDISERFRRRFRVAPGKNFVAVSRYIWGYDPVYKATPVILHKDSDLRGTHVQWFRGGLVFEAHRLLYHSAYGAQTF